MEEHVDLDDVEEAPHAHDEHRAPEPREPPKAMSQADMTDLCMRMMVQTQQVLRHMMVQRDDNKELSQRQDQALLDVQIKLGEERIEERRRDREAQERMEALRLEEARAMQDAQQRLEEQR